MRKTRLLAMLAIGERSRGELASELGISSQLWLSKAYLSPLMAEGLHRADIAQEAQVAVGALQASAQEEGCLGMNTTYTVKHIQKGPTLFFMRDCLC